MYQKPPSGIREYIISDFLVAYFSWLFFFIIRKTEVEHQPINFQSYLTDKNFLLGGLVVGIFWIYLYALTNTYQNIYLKSRLSEFFKTIFQVVIGSIFLSIVIVLDDNVNSYQDYYFLMVVMILTLLLPTLFIRIFWLFLAKSNLKNGQVSFPAILIGSHVDTLALYQEIQRVQPNQGIEVKKIWSHLKIKNTSIEVRDYKLNELEEILKNEHIEYLILSLSPEEEQDELQYISVADQFRIKVKKRTHNSNFSTDLPKIENPIGEFLIDVDNTIMSPWQFSIKKLIDFTVAILAFIILLPVGLIIAYLIKRNSAGPILYKQERIGQYGKPFIIYKFRTMYDNAEKNGPQLSSHDDTRTTPVGKVLRKYRLDEIPQFINVLRNEMSLVGPRPERKYYANQLIAKKPEYRYIYKVQPGITSLALVRFGYASSIEDMIRRFRYDLIYIQNFSLMLDFRIIIYTVLTIVRGKGL